MMVADQGVPVLLLPAPSAVRPWHLLLPAAAVAEVVRAASLEPPVPGAPDWLAGVLPWHGLQVPVVRLVGAEPLAAGPPARYVVVCQNAAGAPILPHFGLASPGLPHLEWVTPQTLAPELEAPAVAETGPFTPIALRHLGQPALLLDLEALELALLAALSG